MNENFQIVLFKNNKKKKKLKSFVRENLAIKYYEELMSKSNSVLFDKKFENGKDCEFNLSIISKKYVPNKIYYMDEMGRNITIDPKIDNDLYIQKISVYKIEELIYDVSSSKKITYETLKKQYLNKDKILLISKLNNKIVIQNDDDFKLFSFKNEFDSERFLSTIEKDGSKKNFIIARDISSAQKKYLYSLLEESGINKKFLYTSYTTYPR
jgi:hypothetical protein